MARSNSRRPSCILAVGLISVLLLVYNSHPDLHNRSRKPSERENPTSLTLIIESQRARILALEQELAKSLNSSQARSTPELRPVTSVVHSAAGKNTEAHPWLIIAIPTVPREGPDRLDGTVKALRTEVSTYLGDFIKVIVMNNRPGAHPTFYRLRKEYANETWISFIENSRKVSTPPPQHPLAEFAGRNQQVPTAAVMKQSLDIYCLLSYASNKSQYLLIFEDDFTICPSGVLAVQYMITKANKYSTEPNQWSAIRCSFGMNGIIFQNGYKNAFSDVERFSKYLHTHLQRRPPDHLAVEFYARESREAKSYFGARHVFGFRYNIAEHTGRISTLRKEEAWSTPKCFEELRFPQVFEVEAWNARDCPNDDLWPCDTARTAEKPNVRWGP